jgi:flagellar basal-body rod protein FlgC
MNPLKAIMQQAVSGMQLESQRITVAAENISNVDTPGYKKKMLLVDPQGTSADQFSAMKQILDETPGQRDYNPSHPMADQDGYVTMSNVSLIMEMADLQQARSMYTSLLDILRR